MGEEETKGSAQGKVLAVPEIETPFFEEAYEAKEIVSKSEKVQEVANILNVLAKTARSFIFYNPNNEAIRRFLEELWSTLSGFLSREHEIRLQVRPYEFYYEGEQVYLNTNREQSFSFKLFRDGVREMAILEGITWEEMCRFLEIVSIRYTGIQQYEDDIVTLLWKADFAHITYLTIEGFSHEIADEAVEDTGAKVPDIMAVVTGSVPPFIPDITEEDIHLGKALLGVSVTGEEENATEEMALNGTLPDTILPVIPSPKGKKEERRYQEITPEQIRALKEEIKPERFPALMFDLLDYLFLLARQPDSGIAFDDFSHLLPEMRDYFLAEKKLNALNRLVVFCKNLLDPREKELVASFEEGIRAFLSQFASKEVLTKVFATVPDDATDIPVHVSGYFFMLESVPLNTLFEILIETKAPNLRRMICDLLVSISGKNASFFGAKLHHQDPAVVIDMLYCLSKIGTPEAIEQITRVAVHPETSIRLEVTRLLKTLPPSSTASKAAIALFNDMDRTVRMEALSLMAHLRDPRLLSTLKNRMEQKDFRNEPIEEKIETYKVLAIVGGEKEIPLFEEKLKQRSFFKRDLLEKEDVRICAAEALGVIGGTEAERILKKYKGKGGEEFKRVCLRNLIAIRTRAFREGKRATKGE